MHLRDRLLQACQRLGPVRRLCDLLEDVEGLLVLVGGAEAEVRPGLGEVDEE
jgi:hypothetical protein